MKVITIVYAIAAAIVFAVSFYIKNQQAADEEFDPAKFIATALVGLIIGVFSATTGNPITEESVVSQLIAYAGLVVLIETWIKIGIKWWRSRGEQ